MCWRRCAGSQAASGCPHPHLRHPHPHRAAATWGCPPPARSGHSRPLVSVLRRAARSASSGSPGFPSPPGMPAQRSRPFAEGRGSAWRLGYGLPGCRWAPDSSGRRESGSRPRCTAETTESATASGCWRARASGSTSGWTRSAGRTLRWVVPATASWAEPRSVGREPQEPRHNEDRTVARCSERCVPRQHRVYREQHRAAEPSRGGGRKEEVSELSTAAAANGAEKVLSQQGPLNSPSV